MRTFTRRATLLGAAAAATTAAVGAAIADSGDPSTSDATTLPFTLPGRDVLTASPRKVFAHYFTSFPISLDDKASGVDYYTRNYLSPDGENGAYREYGGFLRDRPLPREPLGGDWQVTGMATEVTRARDAGLDGFTTDLLSIDPDSRHWKSVRALLTAAPTVDPDFRIVLMPDMNGSTLADADAAGLAAALAELITEATYRLDDGRLVVAPFKAENHPPAWWADFAAVMRDAHGEEIAFVPMVLNVNDVIHDGKSNIDAYAPVSHGIGEMESGSPNLQDSIPDKIARARAVGLIYLSSISPQDMRPGQGRYYEAGNSENLRAGWSKSIEGGADWVQLMTWNDYSESTHTSPSVHNGWVWLDISSYHLVKFKTGEFPPIERDAVYVSHRPQLYAERPDSGDQTKFQQLRSNSMPARDTAEVLTFLTADAEVTANVGGKPTGFTASAGVTATTVPLAHGEVAAAVSRDGAEVASVTSPWPVAESFDREDLQYCAVGSLRS